MHYHVLTSSFWLLISFVLRAEAQCCMSFNKQSLGELEQDKIDYENENRSRSELLTQKQGSMIYDLMRKPNNPFQNR